MSDSVPMTTTTGDEKTEVQHVEPAHEKKHKHKSKKHKKHKSKDKKKKKAKKEKKAKLLRERLEWEELARQNGMDPDSYTKDAEEEEDEGIDLTVERSSDEEEEEEDEDEEDAMEGIVDDEDEEALKPVLEIDLTVEKEKKKPTKEKTERSERRRQRKKQRRAALAKEEKGENLEFTMMADAKEAAKPDDGYCPCDSTLQFDLEVAKKHLSDDEYKAYETGANAVMAKVQQRRVLSDDIKVLELQLEPLENKFSNVWRDTTPAENKSQSIDEVFEAFDTKTYRPKDVKKRKKLRKYIHDTMGDAKIVNSLLPVLDAKGKPKSDILTTLSYDHKQPGAGDGADTAVKVTCSIHVGQHFSDIDFTRRGLVDAASQTDWKKKYRRSITMKLSFGDVQADVFENDFTVPALGVKWSKYFQFGTSDMAQPPLFACMYAYVYAFGMSNIPVERLFRGNAVVAPEGEEGVDDKSSDSDDVDKGGDDDDDDDDDSKDEDFELEEEEVMADIIDEKKDEARLAKEEEEAEKIAKHSQQTKKKKRKMSPIMSDVEEEDDFVLVPAADANQTKVDSFFTTKPAHSM